MKEKIVKLVFEAIREVNDQLPIEKRLELSEGTIIFGREGKLDSLGVVNLIVAVEQAVEDNLGVSLVLADDRAMSQKRSPFQTVGTLVEYINQLLKEQGNG